jgi:co-chaperonin GroES (HSP10)
VAKDKAKYAGTKATLVAIGPNAFKDWGAGNGLIVGDRVLFAQYSGARQQGSDGQDYIIMNDQDVICRLDKEANV